MKKNSAMPAVRHENVASIPLNRQAAESTSAFWESILEKKMGAGAAIFKDVLTATSRHF